MKNSNFILWCLAILVLSSCGSSMRFTSQISENKEFSEYTTYRIESPEELPEKVSPANIMLIEKAIESELNQRSILSVNDQSDITLSYFVILNEVQDVDTYVSYYGRRRWSYASVNAHVHKYSEGTLILDFIDNKSKELVWHGAATDTVKPNQENIEKKIQEAVKGLIHKYTQETNRSQS